MLRCAMDVWIAERPTSPVSHAGPIASRTGNRYTGHVTRRDRDIGVSEYGARAVGRHVAGLLVVAAALVIGLLVLRTGTPQPRAVAGDVPRPRSAPSAVADAEREEGEVRPVPTDVSRDGAGQASVPASIPKTAGGKLRALRRMGITPTRDAQGRRHLDAAPVIEALRAAGVEEGIAVFPPPGTNPPKEGVIVPEGVEIPEGYVRHHQSTDDGEPLEPILMFHPDYDFTDEHGQPIAIPPDLVVPPELVPPGIPIRMLEIPGRGRGPSDADPLPRQ